MKNVLARINPRSLSGTGLLSVLVTILIIAPFIGTLWIYYQYEYQGKEIERVKTNLISFEKKLLANDADNTLKFIDYKRSNTEKRVKEIMKSRVHSAYSLAAHIHSLQKENVSLEQIKFQIKETLRPIRWDNGTGYYFILNYQGDVRLFADRPELEGRNLITTRDLDGKPLAKDMIDLVLDNDSGFYTYRWTKPGEKGAGFQKLTYVKNFRPTNWVIGTGVYLEDMEALIQQEVLMRIKGVMERENSYTFVIQKSGFCLFHPDKRFNRKNLLSHKRPEYRAIVQTLISTAGKKGKGLVEFKWERIDTEKPVNNLGFVFGMEGWDWIIVKAAFLDGVEKTIAEKKSRLKKEQRNSIVLILWVTFSAIAVSLFIGLIIIRRMDKGILAFTAFFQQAADSHIKIEEEKLIFKEFRLIGRLANKMVDDWMTKEKDLKSSMLETVNLQYLLKNITDSMPSILIAIDNKMKVIQWNKAAEKITGIGIEKAQNKHLQTVIAFSEDEIFALEIALSKGTSYHGVRNPAPLSQTEKRESLTIYPLVSDRVTGAVILIDDVTEKIKMEEMMIQSEKMLSVGSLAAGMAHEINNPLSGISQNTFVIQNRLFKDLPVNQEAASECGVDFEQIQAYNAKRNIGELFENIGLAVKRASKIVNDMLSFSRGMAFEDEFCNLCDLMDQTLVLAATSYDLKRKYDFKNIKISRHYDQNLPLVKCDKGKIQQVFLNLLTNGAHAMYETKDIRAPEFDLQIRQVGDLVSIQIRDNGPGIPSAVRKRIFEPFYTTKPEGVGTGLGLSVSYFIVTDHHNGTMEVISKPDRGTAFKIQLPCAWQP